MRNSRRLRLFICALGVFQGLAACDDDAVEVDLPIPTVTGLDFDQPIHLAIGDELVLEATLIGPDGEVAVNPAEWHMAGADRNFTSTIEDPAPGHLRIRIQAQSPGILYVSLFIQSGPERAPTNAYTPQVRVVGYGGTPLTVYPHDGHIHLVPGEVRSLGAYTLATTPEGVTNAAGPPSYVALDPAVASVDAAGVVTALAVGTTEVHVGYGSVVTTVTVAVADGAMAAPTPGTSVQFKDAHEDEGVGMGFVHTYSALSTSVAWASMALDSRAYPYMALYSATQPGLGKSAQLGATFLASWTGTGFGFEQVTRPWETGAGWIAMDARDRIYVYYRDFPHDHVIAERPAAGGAKDWTYRTLPKSEPEPPLEKAIAQAAAMMPREGGGMWLMYRTLDIPPTLGQGECREQFHLAEVTDEGIGTQVVKETRWPKTLLSCEFELGHYLDVVALAKGPGPYPDVYLRDERLRVDGDAWVAEPLIQPGDDPQMCVDHVAIARGREPGQQDQVFLGCQKPGSHLDDPPRDLVLAPGTRQRSWSLAGGADTRKLLVAFHAGPWTYQGNGVFDLMTRLSPFDGGKHNDDMLGGLGLGYLFSVGLPTPANRLFPAAGWADDKDVVEFVSDNRLYTVTKPAAPAWPTDDETAGQRLSDGRRTPKVALPPLVRADGRRFMLTEGIRGADRAFDPEPETSEAVAGALLTSAGPGAPWSRVAWRADDGMLGAIRRLWEIPGNLYGVVDRGNSGAEMARSPDDGATWYPWGSITSAAEPAGSLFTREGQGFVALTDGSSKLEVWHAAAIQDEPLYSLVGGVPADLAELAPAYAPLALWDSKVGVSSQGGDAFVAVTCRAPATGKPAILVQRFRVDDGTLVDWWIAEPGLSTQDVWRLDAAEVTSDGALVVPLGVSGFYAPSQRMLRIEPVTGAVTVVDLGRDAFDDAQLVRLPDGRLLAAFTLLHPDGQREAATMTSADGGTWTEPVPLRTGGGRGQVIGAIAAEPDGGLLAVIGDNFALTSSVDGYFSGEPPGSTYTVTTWAGTNVEVEYPPVDYLVIRVPQP